MTGIFQLLKLNVQEYDLINKKTFHAASQVYKELPAVYHTTNFSRQNNAAGTTLEQRRRRR